MLHHIVQCKKLMIKFVDIRLNGGSNTVRQIDFNKLSSSNKKLNTQPRIDPVLSNKDDSVIKLNFKKATKKQLSDNRRSMYSYMFP